jgi:hypothetical protein
LAGSALFWRSLLSKRFVLPDQQDTEKRHYHCTPADSHPYSPCLHQHSFRTFMVRYGFVSFSVILCNWSGVAMGLLVPTKRICRLGALQSPHPGISVGDPDE